LLPTTTLSEDPHTWRPQGRFGKRRNSKSAADFEHLSAVRGKR